MNTYKNSCTILLFLCLTLQMAFAQSEVSEREVIALLELQSRTKGHLWKVKWDRDTPISEWHGVTVKDGKVVALDLSDNNLQGKIPLTIGNLRYLEHLNLSNNAIEGKMPRLFRKLDNLKSIDVAGNQLEGQLPNTIYQLGNLRELNVANNNLDGELPDSLTELSKLTTLAVANNDFNGVMPEGMEKMKKLKKLYLANNGFTSLDNLKVLSEQQLVFTDVDINSGDYRAIDFTQSVEGLSKLKFDDDDEE